MKKLIAIFLTTTIAIFVVFSSFLPFDADRDTQQQVEVTQPEAMPQMNERDTIKKQNSQALPDYHLDRFSGEDVEKSVAAEKPSSLEETIAGVESSLKNRIIALNQNLQDPSARKALKRELLSSEMEAYKAAVLWKVKNSSSED